MPGIAVRLLAASALLALALGHGALTNVSTSDASFVSAAPEPTSPYVSELGPATSRPPQPHALPSAGTSEASNWPPTLGLALFLGGAVLVYTSLRLPRHSA